MSNQFKIGDRVKIISLPDSMCRLDAIGKLGTIHGFNESARLLTLRVLIDGYGCIWNMREDNLELIHDTIAVPTITAKEMLILDFLSANFDKSSKTIIEGVKGIIKGGG